MRYTREQVGKAGTGSPWQPRPRPPRRRTPSRSWSAEPFLEQWPGPDVYRLSTDLVAVHHAAGANEVVVGLMHPNT